MATKTYTAIESFIGRGGVIVQIGDELELPDHEARTLLIQTRIALKPAPAAVGDVAPPAPTDEAAPRRARAK